MTQVREYPAPITTEFTTSTAVSTPGVYALSVTKPDGAIIGAAVVVVGSGWAAVLSSASIGSGVTPTFGTSGGSVTVSIGGGNQGRLSRQNLLAQGVMRQLFI